MGMNDVDERWMQRALELAERGRGYVEPNPLVGAVLVRAGQVVGEGWHQKFGQAHAEINALAAAGERAVGSTLYLTLEPCCHHGKTPPCTDALLASGVRRVVAAMLDPFPQVAGGGLALLRAAGVEVKLGVGEAEARQLNAPYLKLLDSGRPYVHAKWAMSLDGKIATWTGDSKWISGEASRRWVHTLRGRMDAIIIGSGTVRADDPLLTARPPGPRTATRVVLAGPSGLSADSQLVKTARTTPVLAVTAATEADPLLHLQKAGGEVLHFPGADPVSMVSLLLDELGKRRMTNVLVEGGSRVLGSFRDVLALDEVHVFIAPSLVGGAAAVTPIGGTGADKIASALQLSDLRIEMLESDVLIHGLVHAAPT
jgi:diaminohydroxyphosphoribosylaminopyrimidine deaminase / 5-amino-6-(5-phosphoribosylamino)uracil reductase